MTNFSPQQIFEAEIESWCYALARFPEPLSAKLVHAIIKEMSGAFLTALKNHFEFDLFDVVGKLHKASEGLVDQRELTFHLIAHLPNPASLDAEGLAAFDGIIAQAQQIYPDVVKRFEQRLKKAR